MTTELLSLFDYGLQESVDLLNLGFSDYLVHIEFTISMFLSMARVESIDLGSSRIICQDTAAVGVALIARRGWTSRLAAMCIAPDARGRGVGRAAMEMLLGEASARGDHSIVLEVIENNLSAVRLYEACDFKTERRLVGYEGIFDPFGKEAKLEEIDIRLVARLVGICGLDNLPWQISAESLAQYGPPNRAYRLGDASIVISNPAADQIAIRSVIVLPEARAQGQARRLIQAVIARYPNKKWLISALCPEEVGGLFEKIGFKRGTLSQFQMRKEVESLQEKKK
jgi:ribosomal protein S18 acetylase RimI-like enzyme